MDTISFNFEDFSFKTLVNRKFPLHTSFAFAKFQHAEMRLSNFRCCNFRKANFTNADMRSSNFSYSDFSGADLTNADLSHSDLSHAIFRNTNFTNTNLERANIECAEFDNCIGLLDPSDWIEENFDSDDEGIIVYKEFTWNMPRLNFSMVHPSRTMLSGSGISFAPLAYLKTRGSSPIFRCRILWRDAPSIVVPFNTEGVARCSRLQVIEKV